jgi:hypothetical protein
MRPTDGENGRRSASGVGDPFEDVSYAHDRSAPLAGKESMGRLIFCAVGRRAIYYAAPQLSVSLC